MLTVLPEGGGSMRGAAASRGTRTARSLARRGKYLKKKVVIRIREDKEKLKRRMCTVEHPFGTVKWYHGAHYLLCRGKEKATAELGLSFLAYNLKRAINLAGVPALIAAVRG